jgi:hypothetical protein
MSEVRQTLGEDRMRKIGLIAAVVGGLVAYASAQTPSGNQECGDRDWARITATLGQPAGAPMRNVTFCVRGVLVTADEMEVTATNGGRTYALRGSVTMTVPDRAPTPGR